MNTPPPVPARPTTINGVFVNKVSLNNHQMNVFSNGCGIVIENGEYWYDEKSGLWGSVGGPSIGTISPNLPLPNLIKGNWASGTGTDIFVNGREIHWMEIEQLPLPIKERGTHYSIDDSGKIININDINDKEECKLIVNVSLNIRPYHSAAVKVVQSIQKWKMGGDQIIEVIRLSVQYGELSWSTEETFSQFQKYNEYIKKHYQSLILPPFLSKGIGKKRTTDVIVKRQTKLENYFQTVLNIRSVRENVRGLSIIGIYDPIILPSDKRVPILPNFGIGGENTENPFSTLLQEQRSLIGIIYIFYARKDKWETEISTQPVLNYTLEKLLLPKAVIENQLRTMTLTESTLPDISSLDEKIRWSIIWELLLNTLKSGTLDARIHVSVLRLCAFLGFDLQKLKTIERDCAEFLHEKLIEKENVDMSKSDSSSRKLKIAGGAAVGGGVLLVAGIIAAPLIIPAVVGGAAFLAGAVPVLGLGGALTAGASIFAVVATPTLPLLFGAAGAGLGSYKANRLTEGIREFSFIAVPEFKCNEDGEAMEEEEEDLSEPWKINWETNEVTCDIELEETPPLEPLGPPPPIDRSTKNQTIQNDNFTPMGTPPPIPPRNSEIVLHKANESPNQDVKPIRRSNSKTAEFLSRANSSLRSSSGSLRKSISNFELLDFKPKVDHSHIGMGVCICVNGWVWNKQEFTTNWVSVRELDPSLEVYGLRWESDDLQNLGRGLVKVVTKSAALQIVKLWIISLSAVLAGLLSAFAIPAAAIAVMSVIDNPWTILATKAKKAGKLLGITLLERPQGRRPVTLIGHSLGARVIYHALKYLSTQGENGKGIVENVFLLGAPCSITSKHWYNIRNIVAGRLVNAYTKADWVLAFVHRCAGTSIKVAGLGPINVEGVENVDLSSFVGGHLSYKSKFPKILEYLHIGDSNYIVPTATTDDIHIPIQEEFPNI